LGPKPPNQLREKGLEAKVKSEKDPNPEKSERPIRAHKKVAKLLPPK